MRAFWTMENLLELQRSGDGSNGVVFAITKSGEALCLKKASSVAQVRLQIRFVCEGSRRLGLSFVICSRA
jgi:hypothetical protein